MLLQNRGVMATDGNWDGDNQWDKDGILSHVFRGVRQVALRRVRNGENRGESSATGPRSRGFPTRLCRSRVTSARLRYFFQSVIHEFAELAGETMKIRGTRCHPCHYHFFARYANLFFVAE